VLLLLLAAGAFTLFLLAGVLTLLLLLLLAGLLTLLLLLLLAGLLTLLLLLLLAGVLTLLFLLMLDRLLTLLLLLDGVLTLLFLLLLDVAGLAFVVPVLLPIEAEDADLCGLVFPELLTAVDCPVVLALVLLLTADLTAG